MGVFVNKVAPQTEQGHTEMGLQLEPNDQEDSKGVCKICWESNGKLISPCLCTGSVEKVHETCMINWIERVIKRNNGCPLRCEICLEIIKFQYSIQLQLQPGNCLQKVHMISFCYLAVLFSSILAITILSIMLNYGQQGAIHKVGYIIIIGLLTLSSLCLVLITSLILKLLLTDQIRAITKVMDRQDKIEPSRSETSSSHESSFSGSHSS